MPWSWIADLPAWTTAPQVRTVGWIAAIWLTAAALLHLNDRFFDRVDASLTRYNVPERKLSKLDAISDALVVAVAVLLTLYLLGVGEALWGAIALTTVSGVVVGLAAQRFGENLIAGVVILFERPFQVGDTIEVTEHTGRVEKVTLHSTTLTTPDGLRLTMPNQAVLDGAVTNFSACRERRISLALDVDADADRLDEARYAIRQAVDGEQHLVEDREVRVFVSESLDEGVRFTVRYWVHADHYMEHCRPTGLRRVLEALDREGFASARPAQTVHLREG